LLVLECLGLYSVFWLFCVLQRSKRAKVPKCCCHGNAKHHSRIGQDGWMHWKKVEVFVVWESMQSHVWMLHKPLFHSSCDLFLSLLLEWQGFCCDLGFKQLTSLQVFCMFQQCLI
jgi:hypothetical protein